MSKDKVVGFVGLGTMGGQERAGVEIAVDPERLRAALAPAVPNDGVKGA